MSQEKKMTAAEKKRMETLDRKIERVQAKVVRAKHEYDALTEELSDLLTERYPERQEEYIKETLYRAYQKSSKSLEMIISFMLNDYVTLSEADYGENGWSWDEEEDF